MIWGFVGEIRCANPRTYPHKFGHALQRLVPGFIRATASAPRMTPEIRSALDGRQLFASMPMTDLRPDADIVPLVRYLRSNIALTIPPDWREVLPYTL